MGQRRGRHCELCEREGMERANEGQGRAEGGTRSSPRRSGDVVTPGFEGKTNANHVRARIRTHVHSDYINDSS
jgi:hypothetical protein